MNSPNPTPPAAREALVAEIAAHPKSALIEALADTMQSVEDDDGKGRHISYYQSLAYATVEMLPGLFYDEDATCDEPGCGAHPATVPVNPVNDCCACPIVCIQMVDDGCEAGCQCGCSVSPQPVEETR